MDTPPGFGAGGLPTRTFLVLATLALFATSFVPVTHASTCTDGTSQCCSGAVIPITAGNAKYYLDIRHPVHVDITDAPHVNNLWAMDPVSGTQKWLGVNTPADDQYAPVSDGKYNASLGSNSPALYVYVESNGIPGLQRAAVSDPCYDGNLHGDTLVI